MNGGKDSGPHADSGGEVDRSERIEAPGWPSPPAAVYGLEQPVRCPHCESEIHELFVVRLFRARVSFVSSLPRSGRLLVCPLCRAAIPGELGAVF